MLLGPPRQVCARAETHWRGNRAAWQGRAVPTRGRLETMKTFEGLFQELTEKAASRPEGSKTVAELDAGVHAIGKKIVEEAAEVWLAAEHETDQALAMEASQLIYHVQVMLIKKGISLEDVYREL
ncbi:hypothetical protein GCM10022230_03280 [Pseudoclavibacter caeni]